MLKNGFHIINGFTPEFKGRTFVPHVRWLFGHQVRQVDFLPYEEAKCKHRCQQA